MSPASDQLASRLRTMLEQRPAVTEKRMFGARCLLLHGNMVAATTPSGDLMVRVGAERFEEALRRKGASPMQMGNRTMRGFVLVASQEIEADEALADWLGYALSFVETLPRK